MEMVGRKKTNLTCTILNVMRRERLETQWENALKLGVSQGTYGRYEKGQAIPTEKTKKELEKMYKVPYEILITPVIELVEREIRKFKIR